MARIVIASDVPWGNDARHFNGVLRFLRELVPGLRELGHQVLLITPDPFPGFYLPFLPELRISLFRPRRVHQLVSEFVPDHIHLEYEGQLGRAVQSLCRRRGWQFSTTLHSRYDLHLRQRFGIPEHFTMPLMLAFHRPSAKVFTRSQTSAQFLTDLGLRCVVTLPAAADRRYFFPISLPRDAASPVFINVGRAAPEKNLEAFLCLQLPGQKWFVGDGPSLPRLRQRFPEVRFWGYQPAERINALLNRAEVFVMPSKTETLGRVMLEAQATGLPIAAFPVPGPLDVVRHGVSGVLDVDLRRACLQALRIPRDQVLAAHRPWGGSIAQAFINELVPLRPSSQIPETQARMGSVRP